MIHMIYLAAGLSSRYGKNKLLETVENKPMYRNLLDILVIMKEEEPQKYDLVVVTAYDEIKEAVSDLPLKVVLNEHQELGISHSIYLGIKACGEVGKHDHLLFCVADQPYLQEEELFGFIHMYLRSHKGIGCMSFQGEMGNPVIFQGKFIPELLELTGDTGGKAVVREHLQELYLYEADTAKSLEDIDTPEL
ncbi:MAG: nucleotidyltransferase family protein [Lachnospiraceae bacterium]